MGKDLVAIGVTVNFEINDFIKKCGLKVEDGDYIDQSKIVLYEELFIESIQEYVENELGFKVTEKQAEHIKDEILMYREYFCIKRYHDEKIYIIKIYDYENDEYSTFLIQKYRGKKEEE